MQALGTIRNIARYPVKSMRGEELVAATLGLEGLPADRLYAFVQDGVYTPFPWLTARDAPALLRFQPFWEETGGRPRLLVRTEDGDVLAADSPELHAAVERAAGRPVHLHSDKRGNHDTAYVSLITTSTIRALAEAANVEPDHRRFRMNLIIESDAPPFSEREWVGRLLRAGESRLAVTQEDKRCVMLTLDPTSGLGTPEVLKAAGQLNDVCAGVYASVARAGAIAQGDAVLLED